MAAAAVIAATAPRPSSRVAIVYSDPSIASAELARADLGSFVSLPHPRLPDARVLFLVAHGRLLQLNAHVPYRDRASWFVDQDVHSDGKLYMATPVDPLFLLLPVLDKLRGQTADHAGVFYQRDQLLMAAPELTALFTRGLLSLDALPLEQICESKGEGGDTSLWRLSDERVVAWLVRKVQRTAAALASEEMGAHATAISSGTAEGFQGSSRKRKRETEQSGAGLAAELVGELIASKWVTMVQTAIGIGQGGAGEPALKRAKSDEGPRVSAAEAGGVVDDYSKMSGAKAATAQAEGKMTAAHRQLAKVNLKGVAKLTSFFSKAEPKTGDTKK